MTDPDAGPGDAPGAADAADGTDVADDGDTRKTTDSTEATDATNATDAVDHAVPAEDPKAGTFLVTEADGDAAVLRDVDDGRVHPVTEPPAALAAGEAVVGRLEPAGSSAGRWRLAAVEERVPVSIERSAEPPTGHERGLAADEVGELVRRRRAGEGELHVLTVPEDATEAAVADVLDDDDGLRARAARLGVSRVVVRSAPGLVCVRYLP